MIIFKDGPTNYSRNSSVSKATGSVLYHQGLILGREMNFSFRQ
jgi:hypothetical protein